MLKRSIILVFLLCFSIPLLPQAKKMQTRKHGQFLPPKHHRSQLMLPSEIVAMLNAQYPGWSFVDNYYIFDFEDAQLTKKKYPFDPNLIAGDFNQDSHQDYAIQITKPGPADSTDLFLAFLWTPSGFQQFVIDTIAHFSPTDEYLWLTEKGTQEYNFETDSTFIFPRDAITIEIWERAAETYLYSQGAFSKIITGD